MDIMKINFVIIFLILTISIQIVTGNWMMRLSSSLIYKPVLPPKKLPQNYNDDRIIIPKNPSIHNPMNDQFSRYLDSYSHSANNQLPQTQPVVSSMSNMKDYTSDSGQETNYYEPVLKPYDNPYFHYNPDNNIDKRHEYGLNRQDSSFVDANAAPEVKSRLSQSVNEVHINKNKIIVLDENTCLQTFQLVTSQIELCKKQPESLISVKEGARMALQECQKQFANERWNCSSAEIKQPEPTSANLNWHAKRNSRSNRIRRLNNLFGSQASMEQAGDKLGLNNNYNSHYFNGGTGKDDDAKSKYIYETSLQTKFAAHNNINYNNNLYDPSENQHYPYQSQSVDDKDKNNNASNVKVINVLSKTLEKGTKEVSFIYATASAAVVHAVTKSCSAGLLTDCTCDSIIGQEGEFEEDHLNQDHTTSKSVWKWGGCSDNVNYGIKFSEKFVDAPDRDRLKALLQYYGTLLFAKHLTRFNLTSIEKLYKNPQNNDSLIKPPPFEYPYKRPTKQIVRHAINMHNNRLGRLVVENSTRKQCRCHGVSGSCELKTCWKTVPSFSVIGEEIKNLYRKSIRVAPQIALKNDQSIPTINGIDGKSNKLLNAILSVDDSQQQSHGSDGYANRNDINQNFISDDDDNPLSILSFKRKGKKGGNTKRRYRVLFDKVGGSSIIDSNVQHQKFLLPNNNNNSNVQQQQIMQSDLIHLDKSPNYCDPDPESGILGTTGRKCSIDSNQNDSCDKLCCGRGYVTENVTTNESCNCQFVWCCYVKCETCQNITHTYTCR